MGVGEIFRPISLKCLFSHNKAKKRGAKLGQLGIFCPQKKQKTS